MTHHHLDNFDVEKYIPQGKAAAQFYPSGRGHIEVLAIRTHDVDIVIIMSTGV